MSVSDRFAQHIRTLRRARGWSQEQLAEKADLNRSYVGEIERGLAQPSLLTAEKIAQALELELSTLLADCERNSHAEPQNPSRNTVSAGYSLLREPLPQE
jgi:transcriptional regulator with XRE-family HTH domain